MFPAKEEDPTPCVKCKETFATWNEYHLHKMNSDKHTSCPVCSADFLNIDGYRRHQKFAHAQEQNLPCPGCAQVFTRVGGLMGHIEHFKCPRIRGYEARRAIIQQNRGQFDRIRQRALWEDSNDGISLGSTPVESSLTVGPAVSLNVTPDPSSKTRSTFLSNYIEAQMEDKPEEVDLMTFDSPTLALNSAWGPTLTTHAAPAAKFDVVKDFPRLGAIQSSNGHSRVPNIMNEPAVYKEAVLTAGNNITGGWGHPPHLATGMMKKENIPPRGYAPLESSVPVGDSSNSNFRDRAPRPGDMKNTSNVPPTPTSAGATQPAWSTPKNLFPNAAAAVAPPASLLGKLSAATNISPEVSTKFARYDPSDPNFKTSKYWVQFTGKFKCPHKGCPKSVVAPEAFIQHLKSPAHIFENQKLQCVNCLRYYGSATALTQHSEAQGIRCLIREKEEFGVYIDEITASTAATAGRHKDDTIRYVVNDHHDPKGAAQKVIESNAAAHAANSKAKAEFWSNNTVKW